MTEEYKPEREPWAPTIERLPLFNPFENFLNRTGEPANRVVLPELDVVEDEPVGDDGVVPEKIGPAATIDAIKPAE